MKKAYVIAEAGVNHNGSLEIAKKLIDVASHAGADAVKFQTFKAEKLVTRVAQKAEYQSINTDAKESQFEMIKKLELSEQDHLILIEHCKLKNIEFLSTPFDLDSLALLADKFKLSTLKISSGDLTNAPLLLAAAKTGTKIILSTGMSTLGEIERALGVLAFGYLKINRQPSMNEFEQVYFSDESRRVLKDKVTLLHCTTEYPAPLNEVNLNAMLTLKNTFGLEVGYSDHTEGITLPIAATALGATVIEKHFTLDKTLAGPDHKASLNPSELNQMVKAIREVEVALGSFNKYPTESELKNKVVARKSLRANCNIAAGELLTEKNLTVKRPGDGIDPIHYWDYLGKRATQSLKEDEEVRF